MVGCKERPIANEVGLENVAFGNDEEQARDGSDDVAAAIEEEELDGASVPVAVST